MLISPMTFFGAFSLNVGRYDGIGIGRVSALSFLDRIVILFVDAVIVSCVFIMQ